MPGLLALCLTLALFQCRGQGTVTIAFDGPPFQPPGTAYTVHEYSESGMSFTPIDPSAPFSGFGRVGAPPPRTGLPDNGTTYLQAAVTDSLKFRFTEDSLFDLRAVDLAEYSTGFQVPLTVHFVGYRPDGSIITTDLTTDGVIDGTGPLQDFQTFNFEGFTGLSRVEIPTYGWSLDNLVVSVPEPSSLALLLTGGVLFCALLQRRKIS